MDKNPSKMNDGEEGKLMHTWCIWDRYQTNQYTHKNNYVEDKNIVYEFSTLQEFAGLWKNTDYSNPSKFFFSFEKNKIRKVVVDREEKVLECIMLFKKGIEPKWEDPKNAFGGSLILIIDNLHKEAEIDSIWKDLLFSLIGHSFPLADHITGIRFMDRFKKHRQLKIEVWIDVGLARHKNKDQEKFLEN